MVPVVERRNNLLFENPVQRLRFSRIPRRIVAVLLSRHHAQPSSGE